MAFGRSDAPIFFGRRAETRDLLRKLATDQGRRFLLVTGASGSGKSSLVRAGVWARLEEGGVPDLPGEPGLADHGHVSLRPRAATPSSP